MSSSQGKKRTNSNADVQEIAQAPLRKSKRSHITPHLSPLPPQDDIIPELPRSLCVASFGRIDASQFNATQLTHMKQENTHDWDLLDFSRCDDTLIWQVVKSRVPQSSGCPVPLDYRCSAKVIIQFSSLSSKIRAEKYTESLRVQKEIQPPTRTEDQHNCHSCYLMRKDVLKIGASEWNDEYNVGYDILVKQAMRNKADAMKPTNSGNPHLPKICNSDGMLWHKKKEHYYISYFLIKARPTRKKYKSKHNVCDDYAFCSPGCNHGHVDMNSLLCPECDKLRKDLRRRCKTAYTQYHTESNKFTTNQTILKQSPGKGLEKLNELARTIHSQQKRVKRLEAMLECERLEHGVLLNPEQYELIFDDENNIAVESEKSEISKDELCKILWRQHMQATIDAKKKGKKQVRYSPIMIRFGIMLKMKLNAGLYETLRKVFNLPSGRTLANYDSKDGYAPDGICYETLRAMRDQREFDATEDVDEKSPNFWSRCGTVGQDAMHVKSKVTADMRTGAFSGFIEGALTEDTIGTEMKEMARKADDSLRDKNDDKNTRPPLANQLLIFMFTTWDHASPTIKQVVARYAVNNGTTGIFIAMKYLEVITGLYQHGFFVNNITGDGASENRTAHKLLATVKASKLFKPTDGETMLPGANHLVAFMHPCEPDKYIFIGGEMPHWVKKVANAVYRTSSHKSATNLMYKGHPVAIHMIKKAWLAVDSHSFGSLRMTKLSDDHFERNSYNSMRVYLAVQLLSLSVLHMLDVYIEKFKGDEQDKVKAEYGPLMEIVAQIDRLVDICNGNRAKGCEWINSPNHKHIKELRQVLTLFHKWRESSEEANEFITWQSWEDLLSLVYGIEGVAKMYLHEDGSRKMVQRLGGTDCCENQFSAIRGMNSNPTYAQSCDHLSKMAAFRACDGRYFNSLIKSNSDRNEKVDLHQLNRALNKTRDKIVIGFEDLIK